MLETGSKEISQDLQDAIKKRLSAIPIFQALEYHCERLGKGEAVFTAPHPKQFDGIFESYHGGLLMTIADSTACMAVLTLAGADAIVTTTDMNIRFLAPCLSDVTAEAKVIKFGSTLCPVNVDLRNKEGKLVAVAQVTYMRLDKMPKR